jgi:hypothetical protein
MDYLWTPWRYAYVTAGDKTKGCIFCDLPKLGDDAKARIVHRGQTCYIVLNTFPYTPGHVMVVPFAHLDELQKLPTDAAHEMMDLSQRMERVRSRRRRTYPHARIAALGSRCELCFGGRGNANLAGNPGDDLREDQSGS